MTGRAALSSDGLLAEVFLRHRLQVLDLENVKTTKGLQKRTQLIEWNDGET